MKFPEINTLEDMEHNVVVSSSALIKVAEEFQRKGFYIGMFVGLGLVALFALLRNVI